MQIPWKSPISGKPNVRPPLCRSDEKISSSPRQPRGGVFHGQRIVIVLSFMHDFRGLSGLRHDGRRDSGFRLNPSQSLALGQNSVVTITISGCWLG
jgi:hypothetical protein